MYRLMFRQQMPFQFRLLSDSELYAFKDGQIISTFNKCGLFFLPERKCGGFTGR